MSTTVSTMKAIVCQSPDHFELVDKERPVAKAGEALLQVKKIGICGTDLHAYRGRQPYFVYPRILGHELSAEIVAIGDTVAPFQIGDKVTVVPYMNCGTCHACEQGKTNCCERLEVLGVHRDGGMQQYITVPYAHLVNTNDISLDAAATIECLAIGAHAVRRAEVKKGQYALVAGAGPIGLGVMKFLKLQGVHVIALDMNEERLAFCKQWGAADDTLHVADQPLEKLQEITNGALAQVVFDATGNTAAMEAAFHYASFGGKVVYVSLVKGNISFSDPDFHKKEMTLMGSRNATMQDFEHVLAAIREGHVDTDAFITHGSTFETMIEHFEDWLKPETGVIKAMVTV
ncbi:zinc-binding alcohol dehydrogenase family protein [Paenibacillus yanchengensis]|uniref:Zinc-binding alcohol dehydrogenase family protein n=1 Tax=Paenibacillus yanchengensis TaxID=2035833 RepID=A0ABW4YRF2_9BACL